MYNKIKISLVICIFFVTAKSPLLMAAEQWQLDSQHSSIHFVSIKKSSIAEIHTFNKLSGNLSQKGNAEISIDLASVDTAIEIRNERMKEHLFDIKQFPKGVIKAKFDENLITKLPVGQLKKASQTLTLGLHGKTIELKGDFVISKLSDKQVRITTVRPIVINAGDFGLLEGINKLAELAALPVIASAVPVTADLVFQLK